MSVSIEKLASQFRNRQHLLREAVDRGFAPPSMVSRIGR
jgi:hypothetical protein